MKSHDTRAWELLHHDAVIDARRAHAAARGDHHFKYL